MQRTPLARRRVLVPILLLGCVACHGRFRETGFPEDTGGGWVYEPDCPEGQVPGAADVREGVDLVLACPGRYAVGSPTCQPGRGADESRHVVTLTHLFQVATLEVTQALFEEVMGYNPSYFTAAGELAPVERVSWHEAVAFANALSAREGLEACYGCEGSGTDVECTPAGSPYACLGYRLPTEAEWETATRAGAEGIYPCGSAACEPPDCASWSCWCDDPDLDLSDYASSYMYEPTTQPVGQLLPNGWGLYDVLGNVWEWCHDLYGPYSGPETDPEGFTSGTERVVRGGGWAYGADFLRSANRASLPPESATWHVGFRLARTVE